MSVRVLLPRRIDGVVPDGAIATLRGRSMGCEWSVTFVSTMGVDGQVLARGIEHTLGRVVDEMSTWEPHSAITSFNRAAAGSWLPMSPDFALVLGCALHVARASHGALDPTAGALATLWGFGPRDRYHQPGFAPPDAGRVARTRRHVGWQRLRVDAGAMRVLQPGGVELDFSAIAKGFGVDEVSRYLRGMGVAHHLVEIGGELRGAGMKPDGQPWWVEVQRPAGFSGIPPTRIALHGLCVATSGDYVQGFDVAGRRYSHCIDPRHGMPVDNGVRSVTVVHASCMEADAWATALMVLGTQSGMAVADAARLGAQWLVETPDGMAEFSSSGWRALLAAAA